MAAQDKPSPTQSGDGSFRDWYEGHRGPGAVIIGWLLTRLLMLAIMATVESFVVGDVYYYLRKIAGLSDVGLAGTLNEYPTPVVWILWLPYAVTGGSPTGYLAAFIVLMLLLDAGFTYALWRAGGRRHDQAVDFWLLFVFLIGPLSYLRFDLIPAVLAGGALLAARRVPWLTGALTGIGAAVKLWPALLIGAFAAHRPDRRAAAWGFVAAGFGLAAVSLVTGGFTRLVSPLTWQSGRGLQVESVWATPVMVARAIRPTGWVVDMSRYQAYEIFGPGVTSLLTLSTVMTVLGLVAIVALWVRSYTTEPSAVGVGLVILATVAIMTLTNKTLSPQYLLWMGGPMAALLLMRRTARQDEARAITRLTGQLLLLGLLTHLVFPLLYDGLLGMRGTGGIVLSTTVTAVRNLALVAFTVEVGVVTWRLLRRKPRRS